MAKSCMEHSFNSSSKSFTLRSTIPFETSCLICRGRDQEKESDKKFYSLIDLHSHLVQDHSKNVAAAFLSPNANNEVHLWLMANVDYSNSLSFGAHEPRQQNQSLVTDESKDDGKSGERTSFSSLISTLVRSGLASNSNESKAVEHEALNNAPEQNDIFKGVNSDKIFDNEDRSDNAPVLNEKFTFEPVTINAILNAVMSAAECKNDSPECHSSCNQTLLDENENWDSDASPLNPAVLEKPLLLESKAIRKAFCQVCKLNVCATARQRHVYMVHLNRKDLFKCPECDYTNTNSMWEVKRHCNVQHKLERTPITNEEKYAAEIQMWSAKCFPEWRQKRHLFSQTSQGLSSLLQNEDDHEELLSQLCASLNEANNEAAPSGSSKHSCNSSGRSDLSEIGEEGFLGNQQKSDMLVGTSREGSATSVEIQGGEAGHMNIMTFLDSLPPQEVTDRICHICWEESRYPGRHIAQKHLPYPLYECPSCDFGSYEGCTVNKHIQKTHPDEAEILRPISNLERFATEIREIQTQCFPNRPMKLVRAPTNRPRERHHCQLCSTLVAQSDRQRHVYHRHLKKEKIFECPLCEFSSNYDIHRVKWHIKWSHKERDGNVQAGSMEPISHEHKYRDEISLLNERCFPGWHRKRPLETGKTETAIEEPEDDDEHSFNSIQMDKTNFSKTRNSKTSTLYPTPSNLSSFEHSSTKGNDNKTIKRHSFPLMGPPPTKKVKSVKFRQSKAAEKINESTGMKSLFNGNDNIVCTVGSIICKLCKASLKLTSNLLRHIATDHLHVPLYQCPVCSDYGGALSCSDVRTHMLRAHNLTGEEPISVLETDVEIREQVKRLHRQCFPDRKFKNASAVVEKIGQTGEESTDESLKVQCHECGASMKIEDRQIHVYRHHLKESRLYECPICDFSHHACSSDVKAHIRLAHPTQANELIPKANIARHVKQISKWNDRCFPGWINRRLPVVFETDFSSCRICGIQVRQTSRHIAEVHLKIPLHQCPLCEYGAAESRLVQRHMRNSHTARECKGLEPIPNVVEHRKEFSQFHDQCFPGRPKRLLAITISDDGRRAKCKICSLTISKKRRLVHLLEKHLKKPVFKCKHCLFSSNFDRTLVEMHTRDKHLSKSASNKANAGENDNASKPVDILSLVSKHVDEIRRFAKQCFNDDQTEEILSRLS